jgi:hypothetical protein
MLMYTTMIEMLQQLTSKGCCYYKSSLLPKWTTLE